MKFLLASPDIQVGVNISEHESPSVYFSFLNNYAESLKALKKGIIFYNDEFIYGLIGNPSLLIENDFKKFVETFKKENVNVKYNSQSIISIDKKKKVDNIYQFVVISKFNVNQLSEFFISNKFTKI